MFRPRIMNHDEAVVRLSSAIGIETNMSSVDDSMDQVIAEYLRSALCALSATSNLVEGMRPVYITRLINHVRQQLRPVWPALHRFPGTLIPESKMVEQGEPLQDHIRKVLDDLHDLREVADLGNGYWLPAPLRLVRLPTDKVLVTGGLCTTYLRKVIHPSIALTWIARIIETAEVLQENVSNLTSWQAFDEWLGNEHQDLRAWTRRVLQNARSQLTPSGAELTTFEVYTPHARPTQPQYFRWIDVSQLDPLHIHNDRLMLCRSVAESRRWAVGYWLCTLKKTDGTLRIDREARIPSAEVRQFQYGLDLIDGVPTQASIEDLDGERVLTFRNWLPAAERRLLLALARDVSVVPGRLPLRYSFSSVFAADIIPRIQQLGVKIISIQ